MIQERFQRIQAGTNGHSLELANMFEACAGAAPSILVLYLNSNYRPTVLPLQSLQLLCDLPVKRIHSLQLLGGHLRGYLPGEAPSVSVIIMAQTI